MPGALCETTRRLHADVHLHPQANLNPDGAENLLRRARSAGVSRFLCCGVSPEDWPEIAELAERNTDIVPAFGVHPWRVAKTSGAWRETMTATVERFLLHARRPGIGEIGLDFALDDVSHADQERFFRLQLETARSLALPVVVHSVRSAERTAAILDEFAPIPLVLLHAFVAADAKQLDRFADRGVWFSFSVDQILSPSRRAIETIRRVPLDRLLLESDAPGPLRRCVTPQFGIDSNAVREPALIPALVPAVAAIRNTTPEAFDERLAMNEERFFNDWNY